jgi:hypothetical protein
LKAEKNARSNVAALEQAGEHGGIHCFAEPSLWGNFNIKKNARQRFWVAGALGWGRETARTAGELQAMFGLSEPRVITREIQIERQAGMPICAVSGGEARGYYLTGDPDELQRYIHSLDHRVREIRGTQDGLRRTVLLLSGQQSLEGWEPWRFIETSK